MASWAVWWFETRAVTPVQQVSLLTPVGGQAGNDKSTASSKPRAAVKPQVKHADNDGSNDPGSGSRAATAVPTAAAASLRGNTPSSAKEGPSSPSTKSTAKTAKAKRPNPPPIAAKPTAAPTPRPSGPVYENFELAGKNAPQKPAQDGASLSKGKQAIAPRGQSRKETQEEDFLEEEEEGVYCNEDLYACYSSVRSLSLLDAFQKYLLDCLAAPQKLAMEFEVGRLCCLCIVTVGVGGHHNHNLLFFFFSFLFFFLFVLRLTGS